MAMLNNQMVRIKWTFLVPTGESHIKLKTPQSQLPSCCDRVRRDTSEGVVVGPCEPLLEDLGLADPFWKIAAAEIMTKTANKNAKPCGKTWRENQNVGRKNNNQWITNKVDTPQQYFILGSLGQHW